MYYLVTYSIKITSFNICIHPASQWLVNLEEGVRPEVAEELKQRGHTVNWPITGSELYADFIQMSYDARILTKEKF